MTLDQLASIASIIASASVVVSLIFIGMQLRQNAHLTRMAAAQTSAQLLSENFGRVIENADLAELLVRTRAEDGVEPWKPGEYLRVSNFLSASFRHFEVLHTHRRHNIFEEELWQGSESRMRDSLSNPGVRTWWHDCKTNYAPSFAAFVDSLCAQIEHEEAIEPPA